jgi:hypothetical protein
MRILQFSFKREAVWIIGFSIGVPLIGVMILLAFWLFR